MKLLPVSLGCDKNLVDSEHMIAHLTAAGYELTDDDNEADVVIINTCCFIYDAKQESIDTILEMARLKENRLKALVVCGCLGARYRDEIIKEIPEVDAIVTPDECDNIVSIIDEAVHKNSEASERGLHNSINGPENEQENRRVITTPGHFEYLKIAEGCNKNCTYCIIPKLRGKYRSVPMEELLDEARMLAERGVKELILVAQETTLYGIDLYGKRSLPELLCKLSEIDKIEWIRLLYAYPEEITDELIEVMSTNPKVCHYIDMPIQSGSDRILRMMGRRCDSARIREVVNKLREKIPDICIRTTLIAGFPGEMQDDHEETYRFINEMEFDRLGVFAYSAEEGTPAYDMTPQTDGDVKEFRRAELYELQQAISFELSQKYIDSTMRVIIDGYLPEDDVYVGRSYKDAPDIDGLVFVYSDRELVTGDMVSVHIMDAKEYDLEGKLINESAE